MSPFAESGPHLYARGYSPIPIMPNDKRPGLMVGDEWRLFKGWNDFCSQRPSQFQINLWAKWPNAGVGVACGMRLICIDIDQEELIDPLLAILPASNVQKKGRKGISLFFRATPTRSVGAELPDARSRRARRSARGRRADRSSAVDPSRTGEALFLSTDDTLLDTRLEDLAELPDDIAAQIGEVLKAVRLRPGSRTSDTARIAGVRAELCGECGQHLAARQ